MAEESIRELAATSESSMRGSAYSGYVLEPALFLKDVLAGAEKKFYFRQIAKVLVAPKGVKDVNLPYQSSYWDADSVTFDSTTPTAGAADITATTFSIFDGITFTPAPYYCGVALENYGLSVNALNLVEQAREKLIYALGDRVDQAIVTALCASGNQSDSDERGAQIVYGGNAQRDSALAAGDILTTTMVAEAIRKLESTTCWYWPASAGSEAVSSASKFPWMPEADSPFVLLIAPEQQEAFHNDSQFVNAAEYGGREVILTGEIGKYLGVKIVVAPNVKKGAAAATVFDGESATLAVAAHRCVMVKSGKAVGICYGLSESPEMKVFQWDMRDETRITLIHRYHARVMHKDAIVFLDVADQ